MVAVLKPLTVQPVVKPRYLNRNMNSFSAWYRDNEPALGEYYLSLPEQTDDFRDFVLCQYDVECELQAAARETTYGTRAEQEQFYAERMR